MRSESCHSLAVPLAFVLIDSAGKMASVNQCAERLLKIDAENLLGLYFSDVFSLASGQSFRTSLFPVGAELDIIQIDEQDKNKRFKLNIGGIDESQRQWLQFSKANDCLQKPSEANDTLNRLTKALEGAEIGIWEYDISNKKATFSQQFRMLFTDIEQNLNSWDDFRYLIFGEDLAIFDVFFQQHIENGIPLNFEFRVPVGREVRWFKIQGHLFHQKAQQRVMGSLTDCTQEKSTLSALNNAIETRNIAMQVGNIGIWRALLTDNNDWDWEWDDAANQMFGLSHDDIGDLQKWSEVLHPEDRERVGHALSHALKTGEDFAQRYRAVLPSGQVRYFEGNGKVGQNILGKNCRIDGMVIDQTAIHQAHHKLEKLNSELEKRVEQRTKELTQSMELAEQASQIKTDFLSMMSHELRTPMNAVIGSLDLLTTTKQSIESMDLIDTAKTSAQNLVFILNDILDINKIEAGKLEIEDLAFSISEIIDNVITVFIPTATKANIRLQVYEDPSIPSFVLGDAMRVRQILFNLVGNAIKFTETTKDRKGEVGLHASIIETNEFVSTVSFKISDNGIGIDKATQQKLFMPFTQAERSTTRKYGGTGLGLTICGKLTEMMGGRIEIDSEKGVGSTFNVELPFWRSQETRALDVESLSSVSVAFISFDDSYESLISAYSEYLSEEGAVVSHVKYNGSAKEVEDKDIIFVLSDDLNQYGAQTDDFLFELGEHSRVYLAVAEAYIDEARKAFDNVKVISASPITRLKLIGSIKHLWQSGFEIELEELDLSELLGEEEEKVKQPELKGGVLVVEDNPLNQKLMMKQLNMLGYQCDMADNGEAGRETWRKGNYKLVLTDCHMPKIDGYEMTSMIREIEQQEKREKVPIIAVTGAAMSGDSERCIDAGMNAFVSKPVQLADLRKVLKEWYPND